MYKENTFRKCWWNKYTKHMYIYSISVFGVIKGEKGNRYGIFAKIIRDAQPQVLKNYHLSIL